MGVMRFDDQVGERELELMRPQSPRLGLGREVVAFAEEQQDVRGLRDKALAGLEEWRRKGRICDVALEQCEHARFAFGGTGDIDVTCASLFEREPHKFAASLNRSPVIELVAH